MRILTVLTQLTHLGILFFLVPLTALSTTVVKAPQDAHIGTALKHIPDGDLSPQPSAQPFSTQSIVNRRPIPNSTDPTSQPYTPYTFRLLRLRTILASPKAVEYVYTALERACQSFASSLFDYDLLYDEDLALHLGDFTLQFQDVAEQLSMLAVKTVIMKLIQMLQKGLLGFVEGELIDAQAGVRMIFAFGVLGGAFGNWDLRKRTVGENGRPSLVSG